MQFFTQMFYEDWREASLYYSYELKGRKSVPGVDARQVYGGGSVVLLVLAALFFMMLGGEMNLGGAFAFGVLCVLAGVYIAFFIMARTNNKTMKARMKELPGSVQRTFAPDGIYSDSGEGALRSFYAWGAIQKVIVTPNVYAIVVPGGQVLAIGKSQVPDIMAFERLLAEHLPKQKILDHTRK